MLRVFEPRAGLKALILMSIAMATATAAAEPLSLEQAVEMARALDAGQAAMRSQAAAQRDRAVAAGALPDPEARIGAVSVPIDPLSLSQEDMTMIEVGIMQRFPAGRSRTLSRELLEEQAAGRDAAAGDRERQVRLEVERIWRELDYLNESIALLADERRWTRLLVDGETAAYGAGGGSQAELLDARLLLAGVDGMLIEHGRHVDASQAALARWIGDAAYGVRNQAPPVLRVTAAPAELQARLQRHPVLAELGHESVYAGIEAALARERYKPSFGIDLAYGFRQGRAMSGAGRPDMLSAMVTFDLPLFTRDRQDRELAAARSMSRSAESRREDAERVLLGRLRASTAEVRRLAETLQLYEAEINPLSAAAVEAALADYRSGAGTLAAVAVAQRRRLEAGQKELRLRADLAIAQAEIEYLTGVTP